MRHYPMDGAPGRPRVSAWSTFTAEVYPRAEYSLVLPVVVLLLLAKGLVRGRVGRARLAIHGMDVAAEIIGIRPATDKSARAFELDRPFQISMRKDIESGGAGDLKIAPFTLHISADVEFGTDRRWAMEVAMGSDTRRKRVLRAHRLSMVALQF